MPRLPATALMAGCLLPLAAGGAASAPVGATQLRGGVRAKAGNATFSAMSSGQVDGLSGELRGPMVLQKRFDLSADPSVEFDVEEHSDEFLTHSCSNYTRDGSTVFARDNSLVLKVASQGVGGTSLNSGRVMSRAEFTYGLFTFSAKVPKCNFVWPAIWLLPKDVNGESTYGRWPCSGEVDVLETVHDQSFGTFNLVAGYGSTGGCAASEGAEVRCNECKPTYCTSTSMSSNSHEDRYFVEQTKACDPGHPSSWEEHRFVLNWQPNELTTWVDPDLSFDDEGRLTGVTPKASPEGADGMPTWRTYQRSTTPTWAATGEFMDQCFPDLSSPSAPFDDKFRIVLNIAVGGYGGAPCNWGQETCGTTCSGAVGSELVMTDISVWEVPV